MNDPRTFGKRSRPRGSSPTPSPTGFQQLEQTIIYALIIIFSILLFLYLFFPAQLFGTPKTVPSNSSVEKVADCISGEKGACTEGGCAGTRSCRAGKWSGCSVIRTCIPGERIGCYINSCTMGYQTCNQCGTGYGSCA